MAQRKKHVSELNQQCAFILKKKITLFNLQVILDYIAATSDFFSVEN